MVNFAPEDLVMLKRLGYVTAALLCFAAAASAARITGNSNYGGNMSSTPADCTASPTTSYSSFTFSCTTDGADIMAEAFANSAYMNSQSSNQSDFIVYDFQIVSSPLTDFVLTLKASGTGVSIADDESATQPAYGVFTCSGGPPFNPQCGPAPAEAQEANPPYVLDGATNTITFPVNDPDPAGYTFFAVIYDPSGNAANVSAAISPAASTPEPRTLTLLGFGLLAFLLFRRFTSSARRT
jgi:hypothetical protein